MTWPVADLDEVGRLKVLAAALPGAFFEETVLDAPFDEVWAVAADLEYELPQIVSTIRSVRLLSPARPRCAADIRGHFGLRDRFEVVLEPGWCVMQSRRVVAGMAAVPDARGGTRFAILGGLRGPIATITAPLGSLRPRIGRVQPALLRERVEARRGS